MGLLDRIFGRSRRHDDGYGVHPGDRYDRRSDGGWYGDEDRYGDDGRYGAGDGQRSDEQAVERYRYLLRTAPPDRIEEAHAEAFAQLTPDQRQQVLVGLAAAVPAQERPRSDDPRTLARAATRAELRRPGTLERAFGGGAYGSAGHGRGGGFGPGGIGAGIGATMLGTIGGLVVGTAVADALFDTGPGDGGLFGGGDEQAYAEGYQDGAAADGGDYATDGGDLGGDFGGGFDGGDFGGGFGGDF
ncbi:hypothetical protein [Trujillonella humicola]|uniref:hypothetical protein n=1 Tax=Trujillonella humicola TaxID=3383699 RepID=UPI00390615D5